MDEQVSPQCAIDTHTDPRDDGLRRLENGIELGLSRIIANLHELTSRVDAMPTRVAEILSNQHVASATHQSALDDNKQNSIAAGLTVYNQELQNRNIELHERISTLEGEIQVLKRAEREQKLELAHLKEKEVTFRDIIISKAGSQKITEEEVITAYSVLRQQVQALARNPAYQVEKAPSVPLSSSSKMKHFYAIWKKGLSSKDLGFRIRAQIFSLLDQNILGKCCFGLDIDATQNPQFKGYREIERSLQDFEDILAKSKVSGTSIADWRISTLECIGLLKLPDDYSGWVADKVYGFLDPLISATTKKVREDLWNVILEVCRRAFRLRMLMRMSKEGYACVVPDLKDVCVLSKMEHFAESFGVEGGKAEDRSDEVAYVLFGALTKDSRHLGGDRKVLEKAQVILKRR